jgi:integrase
MHRTSFSIIVSRWLGHKKVQHTLDIYTHVLPDEEKQAIERLENDMESLEITPPEYQIPACEK